MRKIKIAQIGTSQNSHGSVKAGDRVIVYWGNHKKLITISEKNVVKIPDEVSLAEASMALISTFPLAAVRKLNPTVICRGRRPLQLNGVATLVAVTFSLSFVNINPPINQNLNISPLLHNILSKGKK